MQKTKGVIIYVLPIRKSVKESNFYNLGTLLGDL